MTTRNMFDRSRQFQNPALLDTAPPTIEEIEHESRMRKADKLVEKGTRPPTIGQTLYITTSRGINVRRRGGIQFNMTSPVPVEVVADSEAEVAKRVKAGESVCSELGYFDLVTDDGLVCHSQPLDADTLAALQGQASEAKRLADENEQLRAKLLAAETSLAAKTDADPKASKKS